ncbi:MAG: diaminopimelate epimerase [Candidatus Marinimicrobia bacterium]|nr:diaminopimelate epimerase [Candidatus Neomarinimicrobiota bacterium]
MKHNNIEFQKYVAAGNDFIVFESWDNLLELSEQQIISICDRRFGVGADGILILGSEKQADFRMNYFNADGSRGEMCGNGARSLIKYAISRGKAGTSGSFLADDGCHSYQMENEQVEVEILVRDELHPWSIPSINCGFINTGVPHLIIPVVDVSSEDLDSIGQAMNAHAAHPQGANVNILENTAGSLKIRTWERGVNMETLACGTGAAASAIFAHEKWGLSWPITLRAKGGQLEVDHRGNQYWLKGPAELVFKGQISLPRR